MIDSLDSLTRLRLGHLAVGQRKCAFSRLNYDYPAEVSAVLACELKSQGDGERLVAEMPFEMYLIWDTVVFQVSQL